MYSLFKGQKVPVRLYTETFSILYFTANTPSLFGHTLRHVLQAYTPPPPSEYRADTLRHLL